MDNSIFKNPSLDDLDLIEEIIEKHNIEDLFVEQLPQKEQDLFNSSETYREKWVIKSFFKDKFPYSTILWQTIFLIINQKISTEQLSSTIKEKTGFSQEMSDSISQDIISNETIQKEIIAIRLQEDMEVDEDSIQYGDDYKNDENEIIEEDISSIPENNSKSNHGGLGQDLL